MKARIKNCQQQLSLSRHSRTKQRSLFPPTVSNHKMTDQSFVMAALSVVANANANATVAAAAGGTNNSLAVSRSLISFLRMEADLSEERAKRLRKQAATIAEQFGITEESQQAYGTFVVISTHNTV